MENSNPRNGWWISSPQKPSNRRYLTSDRGEYSTDDTVFACPTRLCHDEPTYNYYSQPIYLPDARRRWGMWIKVIVYSHLPTIGKEIRECPNCTHGVGTVLELIMKEDGRWHIDWTSIQE